MDKQLLQQFREELIKKDYFRPIMKTLYYANNNEDRHFITKRFLVDTLFCDLSEKKRQRILERAKKRNLWNIHNDIFEPITQVDETCREGCDHYCNEEDPYDYGSCYENKVEFTREYLKLKLQNIPNEMKTKDLKYGFYWINVSVLLPLIDLF